MMLSQHIIRFLYFDELSSPHWCEATANLIISAQLNYAGPTHWSTPSPTVEGRTIIEMQVKQEKYYKTI